MSLCDVHRLMSLLLPISRCHWRRVAVDPTKSRMRHEAKQYRHCVECKFVFPYFVLQSLCAGSLCYILNEEIFFGAQCGFVSWASCKNAHVMILFYHCFVILRRYVFKLYVGARSCSTKTWMYFPSVRLKFILFKLFFLIHFWLVSCNLDFVLFYFIFFKIPLLTCTIKIEMYCVR